jgi:DNA replication protein DnaC
LGLSVAGAPLDSVAQPAAAHGGSYTHFLGYLLAGELAERQRKRVELNLQFAKFPALKRLDPFDFTAQPSIDRRRIDELATGRFLSEGRNVVRLGPPGVGKTHLAIGLGVLTAERLGICDAYTLQAVPFSVFGVRCSVRTTRIHSLQGGINTNFMPTKNALAKRNFHSSHRKAFRH